MAAQKEAPLPELTLAQAVVVAQTTMEIPHFDAVNPAFKSRYATLGEITRVAREALNPLGVGILQPITSDGEFITVSTRLIGHGETLDLGSITAPLPAKPQEMGSLLTYLRRYSLSGALAICADADDDANVAQVAQTRQSAGRPAARTAPKLAEAKPANLDLITAVRKLSQQVSEFDPAITERIKQDLAKRGVQRLDELSDEALTNYKTSLENKLANHQPKTAEQLDEVVAQFMEDAA